MIEGGEFYVASIITHLNHGVTFAKWIISFRTAQEKELFCKCEMYNGSDVILRDYLKSHIISRGRVNLLLKNEKK